MLILVTWNISSFSNNGTTLPLTWLVTTSLNVTESLNGALLTVILSYLDGNATSSETTSQITLDFYSIFQCEDFVLVLYMYTTVYTVNKLTTFTKTISDNLRFDKLIVYILRYSYRVLILSICTCILKCIHSNFKRY